MMRLIRFGVLLGLLMAHGWGLAEGTNQERMVRPYWPPLRNEASAGQRITLSASEIKMLWSGDVIFRLGFGYWSFVSEQFDGRWSHIGILDVTDDGVFVIHSHGTDETHSFSGVQREPLSKYLSESREIKVMRFAASVEDGQQIARQAGSLVGKAFDTDFALDNDKYYCSEVVLFTRPELFSQFTQTLRPRTFTSVAQLSARPWPDSMQVITNSGIEQAINKVGGKVIIDKKIVQ